MKQCNLWIMAHLRLAWFPKQLLWVDFSGILHLGPTKSITILVPGNFPKGPAMSRWIEDLPSWSLGTNDQFRCSFNIHPWKLTWHWNIPIFNRVHTSSFMVDFPASHSLVFGEGKVQESIVNILRWWPSGVVHHLRNAGHLGSMKPISEGGWILYMGGPPKIGPKTPQNGWFITENPIFNGWFGGFSPYFWKHPYISYFPNGFLGLTNQLMISWRFFQPE